MSITSKSKPRVIGVVATYGDAKTIGYSLSSLNGVPIVVRSIKALEPHVDELIHVRPSEMGGVFHKILRDHGVSLSIKEVDGSPVQDDPLYSGRQEAIYNAVKQLLPGDDKDLILFHNDRNPLATPEEIAVVIKAGFEVGAAGLGRLATSTSKRVGKANFIINTILRSEKGFYRDHWMETPQVMWRSHAVKAYKSIPSKNDKKLPTDDLHMLELVDSNADMLCVPASDQNRKINCYFDLLAAEAFLTEQEMGVSISNIISRAGKMSFRIGQGMDSHRFEADGSQKPLVLGGIVVPNHVGLDANSDGDVLLHAVCNALRTGIGKRSLDDIAGPMCKSGIKDSAEYVKVILKEVHDAGYEIVNLTVMIEGKTPKITPITEQMKERMAGILGISKDAIGIAATTGEGMTPFGQGLGLEVNVNVLLKSKV